MPTSPSAAHRYKGVACILCAAVCFAVMGALVRLAGDLPSMQKSFFRNAVALVVALIVLRRAKLPIAWKRENFSLLLLRSVFGTVGLLCNFYAIDHLLLSDATMLNKLSPFFAIICSYFLLKETIQPFQIFAVCISFLGSLFIIKPSLDSLTLVPSLVGLCGGFGAGVAYTMVRKIGLKGARGEAGPLIVFFFSAFSCLVTLPFFILGYKPMAPSQWLCLLGAGVAAAGGQFSITAAYTFAPAREISVYDYTQVIFSALLGFLLFQQSPDLWSVIGYILICSMGVFMFLRSS